jgi:thioredoxin reductase (NADPH)
MTEENSYDLVVIGAGGSGLSGAMYAARLGLKTLVLGKMSGSEFPVGGVITTTDVVENYPGFVSISGQELGKKLAEHAKSYDLVEIKTEEVTDLHKTENCFLVNSKKGEYKAKTVLFATGTKWRKLDVPGSKELENKGVNYCALCDGPLYKDKVVSVVGGSDSAGKDALVLAKHAKKVYMIYRGEEIHPEPANLEKIRNAGNIEIINNTNIKEVQGKDKVEGVVLDREYKGSSVLKLEGVFVAIGHEVLSDLAIKIGVEVDDKKEIKIDHKTSETNVPGVYAAGDVTDKQFKQLITGVADACTAAYSAYEYISKKKVEC